MRTTDRQHRPIWSRIGANGLVEEPAEVLPGSLAEGRLQILTSRVPVAEPLERQARTARERRDQTNGAAARHEPRLALVLKLEFLGVGPLLKHPDAPITEATVLAEAVAIEADDTLLEVGAG